MSEMKKIIIQCVMFFSVFGLFAQDNSNISTSPKQALEVESLFPMFFTGGFHIGAGYRYERFRVRVSLINGGDYNAEKAGVNNLSQDFKRYYKTSPGIFFGYNVWKNLELYGFVELHKFEVEQRSSGIKKDLHSTDYGGGIGYQFFCGKGYIFNLHFMYIAERIRASILETFSIKSRMWIYLRLSE